MSEQREALAEALCDVMCMHEPGYHECYGKADRVLASDALAQMLADAEQRGADRVAAAALAVVKRACDIECKSPGKHTGCSSHQPYRALIGAALTTGAADRVRAEAWDEGYRSAMTASIGMQGRPNQGASFPADWREHNPHRAALAEEGGQ